MKALSILALSVSLFAQASFAGMISYHVVLDGPSESPANASPGTGSGTVIIDDVLNTMSLHLDFTGLFGTTRASHIHCCTAVPGVFNASVATTTPSFAGFPLGVTSGTFNSVLDLTLADSFNPSYFAANGGTPPNAEAALLAGIGAGRAYWNVHSSTFPGGEIRGFLVADTPEPSTIALAASALFGLALMRRRSKG